MMEQMKKIEKRGAYYRGRPEKESEIVQKLTDKYVNKIDDIIRDKEKAIMEI